MNRYIFLSLTLVLSLSRLIAQANHIDTIQPRKCGTGILSLDYESFIEKEIAKKERYSNVTKTNLVYTIPIVFHIIHSGQNIGTLYNISLAQVNSQITILNQDYRKTNTDFNTWVTQSSFMNAAADCEINFCAAKVDPKGNVMAEPGIDRIKASDKGWTNPPYADTYIDGTIKPNSIWDPTKYFNVWVVFMNDGTLGYAQFPTVPNGTQPITDIVGWGGSANTDGVVLDYRYVGNIGTAQSPYNKGRTATHEVGHWLGLRHINGDSNCGNDFCTDTPTQLSLSSTCPSVPGNIVSAGCGADSPSPPGKMYQNYMDYSEDRCLVMFTAQQKARMQACMSNCVRRASLTTSTVCSVFINLQESIAEFKTEVYPNPSNGDVYVTYNSINQEDFEVSILNLVGQTLYQTTHNPSQTATVHLNFEQFTKGIYFISIKSKNQTVTKRLIYH
jgi:hypothetical protein